MRQGVSVVIPVGPRESHRRYLDEAIASCHEQSRVPDEVFIVDDMNGLPQGLSRESAIPVRTWRSPWHLGVAHAFNFGVALAQNNLCILLGSDDRLLPTCVEKTLAAFGRKRQEDA